MIGMILVTHGHLANEFVAATEHVVGPQEDIRAVCIGPDDDMEVRRQEIVEAIESYINDIRATPIEKDIEIKDILEHFTHLLKTIKKTNYSFYNE